MGSERTTSVTKHLFPIPLLLSLLSAGCTQFEEQIVSNLLQNYVRAQEALASDNLPAAVLAFDSLAMESDGAVKEMASRSSSATGLEEARATFKALSEYLLGKPLPSGYIVVHCPVAYGGNGADWVQKQGPIANPYLGEAARECGTILN